MNEAVRKLMKMPYIGLTIAHKLDEIGVKNQQQLRELGSENALIRISELENNGVCLDLLYALEGAVQGIRWHALDKGRRQELEHFYRAINKIKI